uniref:Malonyl CoA-acyl carrier protein transacylase n=1 Tax=Rheinheimera sp. BAL341 TaxID=1708203 RepID=A0A486XMT0_9GAMM
MDSAENWVDLLNEQAKHRGEKIAYRFLIDGEKQFTSISYNELRNQAKQVAAELQKSHPKGTRALLLYPSGIDFLIAFFGCLFAGVIAVPAYPPRRNKSNPRIAGIIEDCECEVLLTCQESLELIEQAATQLKTLASLSKIITDALPEGNSSLWEYPDIHRDTIAFLQYTSGSTSTPKGVMISHDNLLFNQQMMQHSFRVSSETTYVSWCPLYHDMGLIGNVLQSVYLGATCVFMAPMSFLEKPVRWLQAISDYKGNAAGAPNFAYELCVEKITEQDKEHLDLSHWHFAANGAEPVRQDTLAKFAEYFADCGFSYDAMSPCYGLAEATLFIAGGDAKNPPVTAYFCRESLAKGIGKEIPKGNQAVAIVGYDCLQEGQEVVIADPKTYMMCKGDEVGEIWASGRHISRGYWKKPDATNTTFGAQLPGGESSFLRTGDLGFIKDHCLFITGRHKDLLVIRGKNYYPQDLEHVAEQVSAALAPGASAVFTLSNDDSNIVIALELKRRHLKDDTAEISRQIRRAIFQMFGLKIETILYLKPAKIPKTSSGKIQRQLCKQLYLNNELDVIIANHGERQILHDGNQDTALATNVLFSQAENERYKTLLEFLMLHVGRILNCRIGSEEANIPFVELGIDSINALELTGILKELLAVEVSVIDLLDGESIVSIVDKIVTKLVFGSHDSLSLMSEEKSDGEQQAPMLSDAQKRIWFVEKLSFEGSAYTLPVAMEYEGKLSLNDLEDSVNLIIQRHQGLRSNFYVENGEPRVRIAESVRLNIESITLSETLSSQEVALQSQLIEATQRPFNLETDLLVRLTHFSTGTEKGVLLFNFHHIVADGWSLGVFLSELIELYPLNPQVRIDHLPLLDIQKNRYLGSNSEQQRKEKEKSSLEYWKAKILAAPVLQFKAKAYQESKPNKSEVFRFKLDSQLQQKLEEFSKQNGNTTYVSLLSFFKLLMSFEANNADVQIGTDLANRVANNRYSIGLFVNQVVLRTVLSESQDFKTFQSAVRETFFEALKHQVHFNQLVAAIQPPRIEYKNPLFQIMFVYENFPLPAPCFPGASVNFIDLPSVDAPFDISMLLYPKDDGIVGEIKYRKAIFDSQTIENMAANFEKLINAVMVNTGIGLSELKTVFEENTRRQPKASESRKAERKQLLNKIRKARR